MHFWPQWQASPLRMDIYQRGGGAQGTVYHTNKREELLLTQSLLNNMNVLGTMLLLNSLNVLMTVYAETTIKTS